MKNTLLTFCIMLVAGVASAQCNPQFTATPSPNGNNLLRYAVNNNSVVTPSPGRNATYTILRNNPNSVVATGAVAAAGSVNYIYFTTPGTYTIRLAQYISDSVGSTNVFKCTDTLSQTITVSYPACGSTITYTPGVNGNAGFAAATPAGTTGMSYSWSFGDGTSGTGMNISHLYGANGTYVVTLTATSTTNCTYINTLTITITDVPLNCTGHNASFTSTVSNNIATFVNTTTPPAQSGLTPTFTWIFGDGTPGVSVQALGTMPHTYSATGTYNVSLISSWNNTSSPSTSPCLDTAYGTITISNVPLPPGGINGVVIRNDTTLSGRNDLIRVWLIAYDSAANTLRAIDSVSVDSGIVSGNRYLNNYYFSSVAPGSYLLKAARMGSVSGITGPIPAYHDSSLYWAQAAPVTVITNATTYGAGITLRNGIASSGPGFIGGNISLGANRGAATGVPNMTILLRDNISSLAIRSAITDPSGNFSFSNVPSGLYSVYPEELNYTTTPRFNIAITSAQNNVQNINFNADRAKMSIKPRTTAIEVINVNGATASLYPNPAKGTVTLAWKGFDNKAIDVTILNVTGQLVHTQQLGGSATGSATIDIARLQPGIYSVRLHSAAGDAVQKLTIQP